jgi:hypothetical protein
LFSSTEFSDGPNENHQINSVLSNELRSLEIFLKESTAASTAIMEKIPIVHSITIVMFLICCYEVHSLNVNSLSIIENIVT